MYMLLQVEKQEDDIVEGVHLQWCCASSLDEAIARARATEQVNNNRITVAVVDEPYCPYCLGIRYKSKRLD